MRGARASSGLVWAVHAVALLAACRSAPAGGGAAAPRGGSVATATASAASPAAEAERWWARRDEPEALARAVALWEAQLVESPTDAALLVRLARAEHLQATEHVALRGPDSEDEELLHLDRGVAYAARALSVVDPEVAAALAGGADPRAALAGLGAAGVPAAYWAALNLAEAATLRGLTARLAAKDRVRVTMETVLALEPDSFYGGADRALGVLYASLPTVAGRDLERSAAHFAASLRRAPGFLDTRVAEAATLAVERRDREAYLEILREVLSAADGDDPGSAPENRGAKRRAARLLAVPPERF